MQVIERAEVIGRSFGDNNVVVFCNQFTDENVTVMNSKCFDLEMGEVYFLTIDTTLNQVVSAEVVSADAMVIEAAMAN
jgi:hypothetical protein